MNEELIQRNLVNTPEKMGAWDFYNIGATTLKALKNAKIISNRDYEEYETKKPDALIIKKPQVIAAIEYKQPKTLRTKQQIDTAITQEMGTALALGAKIYIVTDGQKTFWINPATGNEIKLEDGSGISLQFNKDDPECIKLISKALAAINAENDTIRTPSLVDPLPLAQKVWQDLWAVSGATPESCLYTFVEVFIFKYLSDLGVLKGSDSFSDLLQRYAKDSDDRVIEIYAQTIRKRIKELFPWNPKDGTTIINGTIFVSKDDIAVSGYATVFRKILERFRDFGTLENIDYDFKSKLFETFLKESISKKNWGQFFTPLKVVRSIVKMVDIREDMKICDPACGVGKFLLEPIIRDLPRFFKVENGTLVPQITLEGFDKGFDKDEQKTIILAKANMLIYMSSLIKEHSDITQQFSKLFNDTFLLQTNSILGTLARPKTDEYDLILTNPPYVMSGSSNLKDEIGKKTPDEIAQKKKSALEQYYDISAMGIEGLFMEWIIRALKPGGKAFVVVPDGIMNRSNDKRLRDFILDECTLNAVISLPLNTFFTTNKKTYIMVLTKKMPARVDGVLSKERQSSPVFTYLCSEIGETRDVYRFDIEQNDLNTAADLYNVFKAAGERSEHRADKRCKIVSIDEFYKGSHWSVERWWTQEEKIELGIEDEINSVSTDDFASLVGDISNTLLEYQDALRGIPKKKANLNYRTISLADKSCFELAIGKRILHKDFINAKGDIPIFSANVHTSFAYSDKTNISDASSPYVLWGIDGTFDFNYMLANTRFGTTDHCGSMKIKNALISPVYLTCVLEKVKHEYGFDRGLRASLANMSKVEIPIPIDADGDFDLDSQQIIAEQFALISEMKREIREKYNQIEKISIAVNLSEYTMKLFSLSELLDPIKGKSKYTRKYGDTHKGEYPVFSASSNSPLTHIDTFDYDGVFLSWSTNGFAGTVIILDGKFSINGDRGILLPRLENINIQYLKYILEPLFRELAKGRKGDRGEDEFTKLYPSMISDVSIPMPVDENGNISLSLQKEIADRYSAVDHYKAQILEKLDALISQRVDY